jgi:hypothetical protein
MTTKEYKETLAKLMDSRTKARRFEKFNGGYQSTKRAIQSLEKLEQDKYLIDIILDLKQKQRQYQEEMAKMLDAVYRSMQREKKE